MSHHVKQIFAVYYKTSINQKNWLRAFAMHDKNACEEQAKIHAEQLNWACFQVVAEAI